MATPTPPEPERLYTVEEVAERYRTTVNTLKYWRRMGRGPISIKQGREVFYPASALAEHEARLKAEAVQQREDQAKRVSAA